MAEIQQYVGEIVLGLSGVFLTALIVGYRSLMKRIKTLEENSIKLEGKIEMNTALDNERKEK